MSQCRGFTHPFVLLVRSTLRSRSSPASSAAAAARTATTSLWACPPQFLAQSSRQRPSFSSCPVLRDDNNNNNNNKTQPPPTSTPRTPGSPSILGSPRSPGPGPLTEKLASFGLDLSYAHRLAMKGKPTMLYEAAPQTAFLISSYSAGLTCFASGAINSWFNIYNVPPGIPSWVPVGFGVVSFMFAVLGSVFALRPSSIIRSIRLLPIKVQSNTIPRNSPPPPVLLEVAVRRISLVPLPLKRIRVEPQNVVLLNRMQQIRTATLPPEEQAAMRREEARRRREEREYELNHLMTAPFRDARRATTSLFGHIRRGLTGEGFAPVYIDGSRYKLDIDGGYALDNGQALDRIVKIQPDPRLAQAQSMATAKKP